MKLLHEVGVDECLSCGARAPDIAVYEDYEGKKRQCCRMCAYKTPWMYTADNGSTQAVMETIIYVANVLRMDLRK